MVNMVKTVVFILVLMKGSEVVDEGKVGNYQTCSWHVSQINVAGKNSPYSAYCRPELTDIKKEEE